MKNLVPLTITHTGGVLIRFNNSTKYFISQIVKITLHANVYIYGISDSQSSVVQTDPTFIGVLISLHLC